MAQEPDIDLGAVTEALNNKTDTNVQNTTNVGSAQIAHFAMPSDQYEVLTVASSGTDYVATRDGYATIQGTAANNNMAFVELNIRPYGTMRTNSFVYTSGNMPAVILPVAKGETVRFNYGNVNNVTCLFHYTKGNEPQS